jgi:argininosuccinate synthase
MSMNSIKKIVLAYSGGLDTSVILKWLKETYQCPIVAFAADLGQGDDLAEVAAKARATGADEVYIEDLKEEFVWDFVWPMFRANALYEGAYLLGTSIARPLIAKAQVEVARKTGADAVSHGATGKGNDQVRFELTYQALAPDLKIIVPWREWDLQGRADCVAYAREHGIPVPVTKEKPYSSDANLLHISFEGGILEDPWAEPPGDMFVLTASPQEAPDKPKYVEIHFEAGDPVEVDGQRLSPANLLALLNEIGGEHGVGRVDLVENRYVGLKSRGVYETPGGTILRAAHRAVESITLDREVVHLRDSLSPRYAEMVYNGYWFAPERYVLQKLIDETQRPVTGTARLKLYKGGVTVVGRKSPKSLYRPDLVTFEAGGDYQQADATGFIRLNALRLKIAAKLEGK